MKEDYSSKKSYYSEAVVAKPFEIKIEDCNGNVEKMIKRFTKKVHRAEVMQDVFDHMSFKTLSQKKKQKHSRAVFRLKKEEQKKNREESEER